MEETKDGGDDGYFNPYALQKAVTDSNVSPLTDTARLQPLTPVLLAIIPAPYCSLRRYVNPVYSS